MHPPATRVVYNNQPYLIEQDASGSVVRAFGPFTPGTEPSLEECRDDNEVRDAALIRTLTDLIPLSPELPADESSLKRH